MDHETSLAELLAKGAEAGSISLVKKLLRQGANPRLNLSRPFRWACENGHLKVAQLLYEKSDLKSRSVLNVIITSSPLEILDRFLSENIFGKRPFDNIYYTRFLREVITKNDKKRIRVILKHIPKEKILNIYCDNPNRQFVRKTIEELQKENR
jgi:ankyrin repeat protein